MKPEEVFKRYDIRGRYPEEIDEEFAEILGRALGTFTKSNYPGKIVVSRDNKESSAPLKDALMKGLKSTGLKVVDIGVGPTDFAAFTGMQREAVSVQVTSSHLPLEFNGFKFMYPEGNGFLNEDLYTIQDLFRDRQFAEGDGEIVNDDEVLERYKAELVEYAERFSESWDKTVVHESLGGTGEVLPGILEELGAEVIDLNDQESIYMDPPNPRPENLDRLRETVEEKDADMGIATDLDADRVTVYFDGEFLTGDEVFSVLAQLVDPPFVASVDTSRSLEKFGDVEYTRVGDPFVMDRATQIDAELAGEPNGHYSLTGFVPYNSGSLAAAVLTGLELEDYLEKVPDRVTKRTAITEIVDKDEKMERIEEVVRSRFTVISDIDGIKYSEGNYTVLIRPSGSSPKIRIKGESREEAELERIMEDAEELVRKA